MVKSNLLRSSGQRKCRGKDTNDTIQDFLTSELPPAKRSQAAYLVEALRKAGERYDRYAATRNRERWENYSVRVQQLSSISKGSMDLAKTICDLDILTRDDLETLIETKNVETLVGSLMLLSKAANELVNEVQRSGRPRDLAEERWVLELADIYENAFGEPPSVWKSESGRASKFYRFLELCRPETYPRFGKLSRRHVSRILKRRKTNDIMSIIL
jgi:hypothetical protein